MRADFLVAEADGVPVGRVSIRYELTADLRDVGGHVGYAVGPAHRRRGHATAMLRLAGVGVDRVLVTCDDDNAASVAVIESCGGVLEDVRAVEGRPSKRRYRIDVAR